MGSDPIVPDTRPFETTSETLAAPTWPTRAPGVTMIATSSSPTVPEMEPDAAVRATWVAPTVPLRQPADTTMETLSSPTRPERYSGSTLTLIRATPRSVPRISSHRTNEHGLGSLPSHETHVKN